MVNWKDTFVSGGSGGAREGCQKKKTGSDGDGDDGIIKIIAACQMDNYWTDKSIPKYTDWWYLCLCVQTHRYLSANGDHHNGHYNIHNWSIQFAIEWVWVVLILVGIHSIHSTSSVQNYSLNWIQFFFWFNSFYTSNRFCWIFIWKFFS